MDSRSFYNTIRYPLLATPNLLLWHVPTIFYLLMNQPIEIFGRSENYLLFPMPS